MAKESKRKLLFIMVILSMLFISGVYAALTPNAHAAETTIQQKGLEITNSVIGIDSIQYTSISKDYRQDLYLGVLPQENLRYTLETEGSKLDLYYTFVNAKLQKIHVLDNQGSPYMLKTSAANSIDMAKDFLNNYQDYSKNPFYEELKSMLATVDANKNVTIISGNTKLAVTTQESSTTFRWTYTFNGIEAPDKCVALHYENGFLMYFIDNWDLYKIGSTTFNVSGQQAIDIAMAAAKNFSWTATLDNKTYEDLKYNVTNAMVWETVFANSLYMNNPRGQDLLTLYPMRHIWVSFDKFYPGNVYGMNVYVWADTGEIGHIQERFSTMDPPADSVATVDDILALTSVNQASGDSTTNSLSVPWIVLPAFAALTLGPSMVYLGKKKATLRPLKLPKSRSLRIGGMLLCLLIGSTVLIGVLASTVNALPLYGRATIWGSESTGDWTRKHPYEIAQQRLTAAFIKSEFEQNGYSASDYQGSKGSYKSSILYQIGTNEQNYPRVAAVTFDHGVGYAFNYSGGITNEFHYMFEDNIGTMGTGNPVDNGVFDMNIYDKTVLGKTFFAFINTCMSATYTETTLPNAHGPPYVLDPPQGMVKDAQGQPTNRARGMPFAWTHRLVKYKYDADFDTALHMSDDGYARPDNGNFCYIGFHWGSAALNQTVDGVPYWWWVEHFFAYALNENWLVKWALNEASQQFYNSNFGETKLYTGFTAIWPMYRNGDWQFEGQGIEGPGYMKVYGNGNIKLYQPLLTLSASGGLSPNFYLDGQQQGIGSVRLISKFYQFNVDDIHNYEFSHFNYNGYTFGRPANIQVASDGVLTAVYNWDPTYYTLSISAGEGGTTKSPYTPGDYQLLSYTHAYVEAKPNDNWILDKWLLDGEDAGSNLSIDVLMDEPHTLEAVFTPKPSYQYVLSIYDYGGPAYDPGNLVGWQPDGQFATIEGWGPYQYYGWIIGAMNEQASGHIYMYGCGNGPLFVYVSSNGYNWNLVSTPEVSSDSPYWIDCGSYPSSFNYIAVTAEHWNYIYYISLDSVRVETPTYHTLTISSSGDGYTVPSGNPEYPSDTYAHVEAHANPGWAFDHWSLDGDDMGTNPSIDVYMDRDHTLQANFREGAVYHTLTVDAYDGYFGNPLYPGIWIDGNLEGYGYVSIQVTEGGHTVLVDDPVWNDYFGFYDYFSYFTDGYGNGANHPVYSDTYITAVYYPW